MSSDDDGSALTINIITGTTAVLYICYSISLLVLAFYIFWKYSRRRNVAPMAVFLLLVGVAFVMDAVFMGFRAAQSNLATALPFDQLFSLLWHCGFVFFLGTQLKANHFMFIKNQLDVRYRVLCGLLFTAGVLEVTRLGFDFAACFNIRMYNASDAIMPFVYVLYMVIMILIVRARREYDPKGYRSHEMSYRTIELYFILVLVITVAYTVVTSICQLYALHKLIMRVVLDFAQGLLPIISIRLIFEILHKHQALSLVGNPSTSQMASLAFDERSPHSQVLNPDLASTTCKRESTNLAL